MDRAELLDQNLLEFGIFHFVLGEGAKLPGILSNGFPDYDFFQLECENNHNNKIKDLEDWFEFKLTRWWESEKNGLSILCSGGIDSSALVATIQQSRLDFNLIHTTYLNHDNNDMEKFYYLISKFPTNASVVSLGSKQYRKGMELLKKNNSLQNTYGPTLMYVLHTLKKKTFKNIVTGSGPDELFYGMEKYSFKYFHSIKNMDIIKGLELIDPSYNQKAFESILNQYGLELMREIKKKRESLYASIAKNSISIFEAQRMLAYLTVTSQHIKMFDEIGSINSKKHIAPFLDPMFVKKCFSIPIELLIDNSNLDNVEIGKKHLKKFLNKYCSNNHIKSKKIGFHAPTTRFMYNNFFEKYFSNIDNKLLPNFIDRDKVNRLIKHRFQPSNKYKIIDYFLFSIFQLIEHSQSEDY